MNEHDLAQLDLHSPALAQFVAGRILEVIEFETYKRQPWSRRRIADEITANVRIAGSISDTTLGRFLSNSHIQESQVTTLISLISFLRIFDYLSARELKWAEADLSIRSGLALERYFEAPTNKAQQSYLREFAREYHHQSKSGDLTARCRLHVTFRPKQAMLTAVEIVSLHGPMAAPSDGASRKRIRADLLDSCRLSFSSTGPVLITGDLWAMHLKDKEGESFDSIVSVHDVQRDPEEEILSLSGSRHTGWIDRFASELQLGEPAHAKSSALEQLRALALHPEFVVSTPQQTLARGQSNQAESSKENRYFFDDGGDISTDVDKHVQDAWDQADTPDEKLVVAKRNQNLELFKQALTLGADPNAIQPNGDTIIMGCAHGGRPDFIQALIATGKCRLDLDKNGLPPSYHAGLMARRLAGTTIFDDVIERYQEAYELLHAEEMRQEVRMAPKTGPEPD